MKTADHKIVGKGGIHCNCCRTGSVKDSRVALNRRARRKANQATRAVQSHPAIEAARKGEYVNEWT